MMNIHKRSDYEDRPASGRTAELMRTADKLATFHRISWKEAFGKVASAAFRLHRYRSAHNRLLQEALRKLDCSDTSGCNA